MKEQENKSLPKSLEWPPRKVVCVGAVVVKEDRVLFIRQAEGHEQAGKWSIPWGFVEPEETPDHAALRETLEESGIKATIDGLLGFQNLKPTGWIGIIFLCHPIGGDLNADGIETDQVAYLSKSDLDTLQEPILGWCKWMAQWVLNGEHTLIPYDPNRPDKPKGAFL